MQRLLLHLSIAVLASVVYASEVVTVPAVDILPFIDAKNPVHFALTEDILALNVGDDTFQIRRRDANGNYLFTKNATIPGISPITNGRYFGAISFAGSLSIGKFIDDQVADPVTFSEYYVQGAKLFDDDTLVIFDLNSVSLITLTFNSTDWDIVHQQTLVNGTQAFGWFVDATIYPALTFQGNWFFARSTITDENRDGYFYIYERQADLSWTIKTTLQDSIIRMYSISLAAYNGFDTIVLADRSRKEDTGEYGELSLFQRNQAGEWTLQQVITPSSIGFLYPAYLGVSVAFTNENTLLVSAPQEDAGPLKPQVGRIGIFSRNSTSDQWDLTKVLVSKLEDGLLGSGFGINTRELVTFGFSPPNTDGRLYVIPRCFWEPFNVTCLTVDLDNCTEIPLDDLYAFDVRCRSQLSATIIGAGSVKDDISFKFAFTQYGETTSCTSSVHCPMTQTTSNTSSPLGSPLAIPLSQPLTQEGPQSISIANVVPIGVPMTILLFLL
eukprot:TRINITY_DN4003_c0_g1_i1.p1 TRINITY_DN4003_c0_g1~~TRINITY_DN4003_c0_g1_i1.p1  ORF type:complete len:497 (+),score=25.37 TRINITY_DN4003_c0_g1_i1:1131-2621(+)